MSCDNLEVPKPGVGQCPTTLFGIPYETAGRTVPSGGTTYPIAGIVLHCYPGTINELCNEMKCRTKSSVISGSVENSYHYGIGASAGSPPLQFIDDNDVAWTWGSYKNNNYVDVPPPNIAFNWPTLQGLYGINTTPDVYTINIALAIGHIVDATQSGCYTCPTASGLEQSQHDQLIQLLAFLVQEYGIDIDSEHITFHDFIDCSETEECACTDLDTILAEVAAYCPPCKGDEAPAAPEAEVDDIVTHLMGFTEPCCPDSAGCYIRVPLTECFFGELAVDGTLDSYILGLAQDPITMQWCLTRGCLAVQNPLIGCGTVDDPLRLDLCLWGAYIPDEPAINMVNIAGLDSEGCLIESPAEDVIAEHETPITVVDTNSVDLTASGTSNHTIQADVNISGDAGNQIEIRGDGLFADFTCVDVIDAYPQGQLNVLIGTDVVDDCVWENIEDMFDRVICLIDEDMAAEPTWILGKTDVECPVFVTPNSIISQGLAVTDTSTVDLTLVGNVLSAAAIISPNANNVLVDDSGLHVPDITVSDGFCIHMNYDSVTRNINSEIIVAPHLPDNIFQCIPGAPGFSGAYVQDLQVLDTDCINLTYANRQLSANAIISNIGDNILTCDGTGLYVPVGAGIAVSDTDCLNLTLVGGIISGVITLAPTQGLIPNVAQCIAGQGLYVPQGADLQVVDTNCIDLTINNGVLTADLILNPSGDNALVCGPGGLYVPIGSGLAVNDTDCVNHSLVGGVLTTVLNIAGPQGGIPNVLSCVAGQGLYVPESHIGVVDTTCIDLDFTGGILRADIIIDPTGDNQVQCLPAGLYVPPTAGLIALDTDCIALNLAGDTLTATPIIAPAQGGIPNGLQCIPDQGLYVENNIVGLDVFSIADLFANTQLIVAGNTIVFRGENGATATVSAVDTVTINGHMLCASGLPTIDPPTDLDQTWIHIDTNTGKIYTWNCDINKWETCLEQFEGTAPPDGTECATPVALNSVTNGNWCTGTTLYHIEGGVGDASFDRTYKLTDGCQWVKIEGSGFSRISSTTFQNVTTAATPVELGFDTTAEDQLGGVSLAGNSIVVEETGCYEIYGSVVIRYVGDDFVSSLLRLVVYVEGGAVLNIGDVGGYSLTRPANDPIDLPVAGSTTLCLTAGDEVTLSVLFDTEPVSNFEYDITQKILQVALTK